MNSSRPRDGTWGAAAQDWADAQEATLKPMFDMVLNQTKVGQGSNTLDVACGTGLFCALAAERGATVAGIDASPGQLAVARARLPQADFREGEMEALPFADDAFDLVTCCNALQYATDNVVALREMRRVAHSGGTVGILTVARTPTPATGVVFGALNQFRAPNPNATPKTIFQDPEALERFMREAGLDIYTDEEIDTPWDYPDLDTALRGSLSFAPGVRAIRAHGKEVVYAAVTKALEPFRTASGGYHLPNKARYVLARVP